MNQSNQYVLDLWLIFQKPIRFGIEKLKGKKKMNLNAVPNFDKNPIVSFSILANVTTLDCIWGYQNLKQETQLKM